METVKTYKFKNTSSDHIRIDHPFSCSVKPGGELDVPEHLARPFRMDNGGRRPSVIEQLAPQMKPVDKDFAAEWAKVPDELASQPRSAPAPTLGGLLAAGVPRGVAEAIVAARKAKAEDEG